MKFSVFVCLALIGCAYCLQAPLLYKYKYFGSILNGIPKLSRGASGWAMKADVSVYTLSNHGEAVFEVRNVKMTEFADELQCNQGEIPDELFSDIADSNIKTAFETPFKVHLFSYEDFAMEYVEDDYLWLTNMRKGIASVFRNEILKGNIENQINETVAKALHEGRIVNVFSVDEETLFGICKIHYTLHPIYGSTATSIKKDLENFYEQDVQRKVPENIDIATETSPSEISQNSSKSSDIPNIEDDLWHVVRSIDFDKCKESVALEGVDMFDLWGENVGLYDWIRSQSSVSELFFRGSAGNFRLEKAVVAGARTMAPYGMKAELLQTTINQTFQLVSVESVDQIPNPEGNLKHSKTWMQHFFSPLNAPTISNNYPWIEYDTEEGHVGYFQIFGVKGPNEEQVEKNKNELFNHILKSLRFVVDPIPGETIEPLLEAVNLMKEMNKEEVLETFFKLDDYDVQNFKEWKFYNDDLSNINKIKKIYQQLVVDTASASGTGAAYEAIIELAKEGKVSPVDVMTTIMTIINNSEGSFDFIIDYVVTLNITENSLTAPTTIINSAYYLNALCSTPQARENFAFGTLAPNGSCPDAKIKDTFVPYLEGILFDKENNNTWEKIVAIVALRVLENSYSYQILSSVITEERMKFPINIRVHAIESLDGRMFSKYNLREPVMNLLTDILSKVGEDFAIRESALRTIMTWDPENEFFYRLAKMSWIEPSKRFSTLLTSIIEAIANLEDLDFVKNKNAASVALKFSKPVPLSIKYKVIEKILSYYVEKKESFTYPAWLNIDRYSKDKSLYNKLINYFGGSQDNQIEIGVEAEELFNLYEIVTETLFNANDKKEKSDGNATQFDDEFYSSLEETIKSKIVENADVDAKDFSLISFQHLKLLLPSKFSEDTSFTQLHESGLYFAKLIMPINLRTGYPSELGLPIIMEIFNPVLSSLMTEIQIGAKEDIPKVIVDLFFQSRVAEEYRSSIGVLLPWSKQIADVQFMSNSEVNLPLQGTASYEIDIADIKKGKWSLELQLLSMFSLPLLGTSSKSEVQVKPIYPTTDVLKHGQEQGPKLYVLDAPGKNESEQFTLSDDYTGLNFDVKWLSNMEFPFTANKIQRIIKDPSSFVKAVASNYIPWTFTVELNSLESKTKNISFEFTGGKFGKVDLGSSRDDRNESLVEEQKGIKQTENEGATANNEQNSSARVNSSSYLLYEDSNQERDEKLQSIYGGPGHFKSLKFSFIGDDHRDFEILFTKANSKQSNSRRLKQYGMTLIRSPITGVDANPALACINYETSLPSYSKLFNLVNYSSDDSLLKETKLEVSVDCVGEPIIGLEGKYKVSEAWVNKLQQEDPEQCSFDVYSKKQTLNPNLIYDDIKFDLKWKSLDKKEYPIGEALINELEGLTGRFSANKCYTSDKNHEMEFEIHRCPVTENWNIKVLQNSSEDTFKQIPHNYILNYLFSIGKKTSLEPASNIQPILYSQSDNCIIGIDSVRTFDGYTYRYNSSQCWSVASQVCNKEKGPILLVRSKDTKSSIPEVKYIDVQKGIVVECSLNEIKVNGKLVDPTDSKEIIKDDEDSTLLTVIKEGEFTLLKFDDNFYISIKNEVVVHAPQSYAGSLCGMCGNFNEETLDDLIGPHRCSYSDPNTFVASWTGMSDTCDSNTLQELRDTAESYQNNCSSVEAIYESRPPIPQQCLYPAKSVLKTEESFCISQNYLLFCNESCKPKGHHSKNETFLCWPVDKVPDVFRDAISSNASAVVLDPAEHYASTKVSYVNIPNGCLPRE